MSRLVYVAGPYTADSAHEVFNNILRARVAAVELWRADRVPIVPHLNSAFMDGVVSYEKFIEGDLEILRAVAKAGGCVLLVGRWEKSKGCIVELEEAQRLNMRIFQTLEGLIGG